MRMVRRGLIGIVGAALLLAPATAGAAGGIKIFPNTSYIGETTQEIAYHEGEHLAGTITFHVGPGRKIDGFNLTWICDGEKFNRMTYVTTLSEPPFEAVPLAGRSISFHQTLPWYDFDPGRANREGTARVTVKGRFFKRYLKPRRKEYPLPLSTSSIASGTVAVVDGNCRVHARWELNRDNTQRGVSLRSF
jgi:hypothetical protein